VLLPSPVQASEAWAGSIAIATDYIYRGISQTRGEPALQGGLQLQTPSGWSAGLWGSTVDFHSRRGPTYEIALHATRAWSLGPDWSTQLSAAHHEYPNEARTDYDYDELTASLSFQQRVTASVAWSPNTSRYGDGRMAANRRALSYEMTVLQPLNAYWSLSAGAGHYDLRDLFGIGYWFWNAGIAFSWDTLQVDLLHIDADATAERLFGYSASGDRWTAAFTWRF
jgi:uncharacterized protein (TIGR02001 family)